MRVLVGLSGGVDSLSVALLLKNKGYDVIGLFLDFLNKTGSEQEYSELKLSAKKLGIEVYRKDLSKEFESSVISYFQESYISGITPNVCVFCNERFKIPSLISFLDEYECERVATGHYANISYKEDRYIISMAKDRWKDQSYMIHRLSQEALSKLIFPLGGYFKQEIKELMSLNGFDSYSKKRESYSICFIQNQTYKDYLLSRNPELSSLENGEVLDMQGNIIGTHQGYPFYTIGQYKGLNLKTKEKLYINKIIPQANQIIVGTKELCCKSEIEISQINFIQYPRQEEGEFLVKIRGKDVGEMARVVFEENSAKIFFSKAVFAPIKGQGIVLYDKEELICAGEII